MSSFDLPAEFCLSMFMLACSLYFHHLVNWQVRLLRVTPPDPRIVMVARLGAGAISIALVFMMLATLRKTP